MSAETRPDVEAIEHLNFDHTPMCEVKNGGCNGTNKADYAACYHTCCPRAAFACSSCVSKKIARGIICWTCTTCGACIPPCGWLDMLTLHPLGGAA